MGGPFLVRFGRACGRDHAKQEVVLCVYALQHDRVEEPRARGGSRLERAEGTDVVAVGGRGAVTKGDGPHGGEEAARHGALRCRAFRGEVDGGAAAACEYVVVDVLEVALAAVAVGGDYLLRRREERVDAEGNLLEVLTRLRRRRDAQGRCAVAQRDVVVDSEGKVLTAAGDWEGAESVVVAIPTVGDVVTVGYRNRFDGSEDGDHGVGVEIVEAVVRGEVADEAVEDVRDRPSIAADVADVGDELEVLCVVGTDAEAPGGEVLGAVRGEAAKKVGARAVVESGGGKRALAAANVAIEN